MIYYTYKIILILFKKIKLHNKFLYFVRNRIWKETCSNTNSQKNINFSDKIENFAFIDFQIFWREYRHIHKQRATCIFMVSYHILYILYYIMYVYEDKTRNDENTENESLYGITSRITIGLFFF